MKHALLFAALITSFIFSFAQVGTFDTVTREDGTQYALPLTAASAKMFVKDGYTTSYGWKINIGDTIRLGRGSMADKQFAFINESSASFGKTMDALSGDFKEYEKVNNVHAAYANSNAIIKKIFCGGSKKTGYTVLLKVGIGLSANYIVSIENALEAGEVVLPKYYAKAKINNDQSTEVMSVADEIRKLKDLLDAGIITQDEFDARKKKLLNQ